MSSECIIINNTINVHHNRYDKHVERIMDTFHADQTAIH